MKYLLYALLTLAALIWGAWFIVLPKDMLERRVEAELSREGVVVDVKGLRKGLFYSITIEALDISKDSAIIASVYDISVEPIWGSLLKLKAGAHIKGELGGGWIVGDVYSNGKLHEADIKANDVRLSQLDMLALTGQEIDGTVKGEMTFKGNSGKGKVSISNLVVRNVEIMGFPLPQDIFHSARGAFEIKGNNVYIPAFSLEGNDLYARLSGSINRNSADMSLEIMPESGELDSMLNMALGRYKAGKGKYVVPIKRKF
jgi:type II secretion system protein N